MNRNLLLDLLEQVREGSVPPADAALRLADLPFEDTGFAKIDHHRSLRTGMPEVIFAAGKEPEQVAEIFDRMVRHGSDVLATRASEAVFQGVLARVPEASYHAVAKAVTFKQESSGTNAGSVAVLCAGTSDLPVAEEAAVAAEFLGAPVERIYDV